jgi:hypothetical protein
MNTLCHYWKKLHGGARLWHPKLSFEDQHWRAKQLQIGLVGVTKRELIKRFGPPDTDMPNQSTAGEPLELYVLQVDEYLFWDLDATTVLWANFSHGVCVQTRTGELFY